MPTGLHCVIAAVRKNDMARVRIFLAAFALLCPGTLCLAGAPMGVANMTIATSVDGCIQRGARALERQGYIVSPGNNNFHIWGNKDTHHALFICTPAPDGLTQVSIVVALLPPDTINAAVAESEALKKRMEEVVRDRDWDRRR